jgi:acyl carrier protein
MTNSVAERVKKIVARQLHIKYPASIPSDAVFTDELGADSLDTVELVMALEEEFDCAITDDEAERMITVQQAVDHVERALASRMAA